MTEAPVQAIPTDPKDATPEQGIALCLSGGGYRAMVFHIGALWRLYELRLLDKINRISSVSGGSITAGLLALRWRELSFNPASLQNDFVPKVVGPPGGLLAKQLTRRPSSWITCLSEASLATSQRLMTTICSKARRCRTCPMNPVSSLMRRMSSLACYGVS